MKRMVDTYVCADSVCRGRVAKLLAEDEPGQHTYIYTCRRCHREYGNEWITRHWGESEPVPALDLEPWPTELARALDGFDFVTRLSFACGVA